MDLEGVTFASVANSEHGAIDGQTRMVFAHAENYLTATYAGGVVFGHVIATQPEPNKLDMLYHCVDAQGLLRAGQATAILGRSDGRRTMALDWQWLTGDTERGESYWVEVNEGEQ